MAEELPGDEIRSDDDQAEQGERREDRARKELWVLKRVLERTGRRLRRPVMVEGALWYATVVLAVVVASLLAAAFLGEGGYAVGRQVLVMGVGAATVAAAVSVGLYAFRQPDLKSVARRVQRHSSAFRSDLVAALEFGEALSEEGSEALEARGTSPTLAAEHVHRTLKRAQEESESDALDHLVPRRDLGAPLMALSGAAVLVLIPLLFNPGWTLGVLSGERLGAPVVGERVVEETVVGAVEGVFVYPSYTGRDRQFRQLGMGELESLAGTEVHLRATLMPGEWESLEMVVEIGDQEPEVIEMELAEGRQGRAQLRLEEDGTYWFRATRADGRPVEESERRRIRVNDDPPPTVEITSHRGRVSVKPDEVVRLKVEASDEFGIDALRRVHYFQGAEEDRDEEWLEVEGLDGEPRRVETEYELDLRALNLQPKDAIAVRFEARDVNRATGPGIGESEEVIFYVESPEDKHMENLGRQQEAVEVLLMHLADWLESPVGERERQSNGTYRQRVQPMMDDDDKRQRFASSREVHGQMERVIDRLASVEEELVDDELMAPRNLTLFEGMSVRLEEHYDEGHQLFERLDPGGDDQALTSANLQEVADYAASSEDTLEDLVLELEELVISQKMDLVERTADEIRELQERLRDLMEEYRDSDDPDLKAAIEREMQRLRQRINELMARMQMQLRQMPQDHVNLEAMGGEEMAEQTDGFEDQMKALEEMFADGDIDGALELLDEMDASLDDLGGEMSESFSQMQPGGVSEFDEAVSEMMDEVGLLREQEEELELDTRDLQEALRESRQEELEAMMAPVIEELMGVLAPMHEDMEGAAERDLAEQDRARLDQARRAVGSLKDMVQEADMEQSLRRAEDAMEALRSMRSTMQLSSRYVASDSQRERDLERSMSEANEWVDQSDWVRQRIEEFMEQAQESLADGDVDQFDELAGRQQDIAERADELWEKIEEKSGRYPQLMETLGPAFEGARGAMGDAQEALEARRVQHAVESEREAIEYLSELDDGMGQALQQQREQERESEMETAGEEDEIEIPGEDGADEREALRQELMEGMRDGRSAEFEREIESYFRSLME